MSESTVAVPIPASRPVPRPRSTITTHQGLRALASAAGLGLAGDLLLRQAPWGLNLLLWTLLLGAATLHLQRSVQDRVVIRPWLPLAVAVAAMMTWRDSPTLKALDLAALGLVLALASWSAHGGSVRLSGLIDQVTAVLFGVFEAWAGAAQLVFQDVRWGELPRTGLTRNLGALLRGLAIALPVVGVFAALLASADARFEGWIGSLFAWNVDELIGHVVMATVFAWLAGGILRAIPLAGGGTRAEALPLPKPRLGVVEVSLVLGLTNALFLAFVVFQLPYLFGSAALVEAPGHASYADYARRGFFELVTVAGLVLPVLLLLHWFLKPARALHLFIFRGFAWMQLLLVSVIVASALHRMRLYQGAYGLTELRLYTTAFMLWIMLVLAWFGISVLLRGRREEFAFGALVAGGVVLALLHAANPDAFIVRTNARLASADRAFDVPYATSLSADAVPALAAALASLPRADRCEAAQALHRRWGSESAQDWRAWSWSRGRARAAVHRLSACAGSAGGATGPAGHR